MRAGMDTQGWWDGHESHRSRRSASVIVSIASDGRDYLAFPQCERARELSAACTQWMGSVRKHACRGARIRGASSHLRNMRQRAHGLRRRLLEPDPCLRVGGVLGLDDLGEGRRPAIHTDGCLEHKRLTLSAPAQARPTRLVLQGILV